MMEKVHKATSLDEFVNHSYFSPNTCCLLL